MPIKLHPRFAVHPGPWLKSCRSSTRMAFLVTDAGGETARHAAGNEQPARRVARGSSAEMAMRFEKAFGLGADTLMRMQAAHDLAQVRAREGTIIVERVAA